MTGNIEETKKYLRKLEHSLKSERIFHFGQTSIYNKQTVDDMLCCLIAVLPEIFKDAVEYKIKNTKTYQSVEAFRRLTEKIRSSCPLSSKHYMVDQGNVAICIQTIIRAIDNDVRSLESNNNF